MTTTEAPHTQGDPPEPAFAVETEQRLSRSILWALQRSFFHQAGIEAWRTTTVPHYVTNNPVLAHAYADAFIGFLRDCRAAPLEPDEPVTLIELGAGSGRFAYLFLRSFVELRRRSPVADVRFRYVMTDFTETNLAFWRAHDALRPFVEEGILDFGVFDVERDGSIELVQAGVTLAPGTLRNPVGVIANYVFDGISQDAFSFEGGQLRECLITLSCSEPAPDLADPALVGRLATEYTRRPAPLDYYEEPALNAILRGYAGALEGATILFPSTAIRCLDRLAALAGGRLFLLSGDRGQVDASAVGEAGEPGIVHHGSFSMNVNYHAIGEHVRGSGGAMLTMAHRHAHLAVSAFLLGPHPTGWAETRFACRAALDEAGPDDFFSLRRGIQGHSEDLAVEQLLSLVRMSRWDPRILRDCLPALWKHLGDSAAVRAEVVATVMRVWESYYFMGEDQDLAFELGLLVYGYQAYAEALALFQASGRLYGEDPRTLWNMGLCHYALGDMEAALQRFEGARRAQPDFVPARAVQVKEGA